MKNFTKLLAVATALFAFACTTDTTEDLGVELGGKTTLTLSLEETTKTHLGEKVGDEYPLFWSAGDKIAINGVASEPLTEAAHGASVANFVLNGELAYPYNVVYPAPADGVVAAEGKQAVTFLAAQNYKEGTFAEGAAPMYALVAEGEAISLQHLSGLICLAPMGEATLTSMTISAEKGKIAGNFDVDWDAAISYQFLKCLNVTLSTSLKYYNGVKIADKNGDLAERVQFKGILGLGVGYSF